MRNLILKERKQYETQIKNVKHLLLNPNRGLVGDENNTNYFVTSDKLYKWNEGAATPTELVEVPGIVGAEYLALDNTICLATDAGEVLIVDPRTGELTEGTFCNMGIEQMAWSPDQEVVAFVTKHQNVVVMTCTYDPIAEHELYSAISNEEYFVNVGWGKKETQFHGSKGKSAAKMKEDFKPPDNIDKLPQNIEITWRGDGAFFAVSFVQNSVGRMFKVFDKKGDLLFVSEKQNNLKPEIKWRPTGKWIAVPQQFPNKSVIALFEHNGLRNSEIVLPFKFDNESVTSLSWNPDSTILTIQTVNEDDRKDRLYMYTINNYHWYLKSVLQFEIPDRIAYHIWDNKIGEEKRLHILLLNGQYIIYRWRVGVIGCANYLVVIDGRKLMISNFNENIIPPPMCNRELEFDNFVVTCAVNDVGNLCVYDSENRYHFYSLTSTRDMEYLKCGSFDANREIDCFQFNFGNFLWIDESKIVTYSCTNGNSKIILIEMSHTTYNIIDNLQINGIISTISNCHRQKFYIQMSDGKVQKVECTNDKLTLYPMNVDIPLAEELYVGESLQKVSRHFIALTTNRCLYINSNLISTDVTSYYLLDNYMAYTTLSTIRFWKISENHTTTRQIECGGKLVNIRAFDASVVLQMPRGNLEAYKPRELLLELIDEHLSKTNFKIAMSILRKHRINLNIICDYNMSHFVKYMRDFIVNVDDPSWLNLFISNLQNEDVTTTMYANYYKSNLQCYPKDFHISNKVNYICERLRQLFTQQDNTKQYRLPLITTLVKLKKLEEALVIISNLWKSNSLDTDETLKYLLYLVDVNELFNAALATSDFRLVTYIAEKSQKDPKEFLPFLKELEKYEENYRKFKINEHLKRHHEALKYLALCGEEHTDEAMSFIKRHKLFQFALRSYKNNSDIYRRVCLIYADHLRANGKLEWASIMYERGGNFEQAMLSAKNILDWQRVLVMAKKAGKPVHEIALSMVGPLETNNRYEEAYSLLKLYSSNEKARLQMLTKGTLFLKAIFETRLMDSQGDSDHMETLIEPELKDYCCNLRIILRSDDALFDNYKQRLLELRKLKSNKSCDDKFDVNNGDFDESDLISDTTSVYSSRYSNSSRGTGKSFCSSKNRRKHERKVFSLKPGNSFEDIALIDALYDLIMKIVKQQQHVHDICKALIEIRQDEEAIELQKDYKNVLNKIQNALDDIWIPELIRTQQFLTGPNIDYTQLQNEQRYSLLSPEKRFKPQLKFIEWDCELLYVDG